MKLWGCEVIADDRIRPGAYYFMNQKDVNMNHLCNRSSSCPGCADENFHDHVRKLTDELASYKMAQEKAQIGIMPNKIWIEHRIRDIGQYIGRLCGDEIAVEHDILMKNVTEMALHLRSIREDDE